MPRGRQEPAYSWCGSWTRTEGRFAAETADVYGLSPLPWQRSVLDDWLAIGDDGRLLNSLCVLAVPRQCGKTGVCDPRETWGLIHRGEWILHTAQEYQTAQKAFDRLRKKFGMRRNDPLAEFPELNAMVKRYTVSAGQMVLDLDNGGHIEFRTRGTNSDMGRGGTFDLVVVDEAQSYTDAQDAALSPLNSAAPHGSPQTILMGTVPDPTMPHKGEKFATIRSMLHSDPYEGACIHEWSTPEVGDPMDVARWYEANPSLGYHLLESALLKDAKTMTPESFAREHLGWWPESVTAASPVDRRAWDACATDRPTKEGILVYAVKFSPDGTTGALAACYRPRNEGKPFVYVVESRNLGGGMRWFVDELSQRWRKAAQIVIDGPGNAQTLNDRLIQAGVAESCIVRPSPRDVVSACSRLANAAKEHQLSHYAQPALDAAVTMTTRRRIGSNGGWGFASTDEGDATLAEAAALALWGAMTTKRDPERKAVVW